MKPYARILREGTLPMKTRRMRLLRMVRVCCAHAAFMGLLVATSLPARAADERAVKQRVHPVYPEIAKRLKITGEVKVNATVDAEGKVMDAKATSGNSALTFAAEEAVRKWKFVSGEGVAHVEVAVKFEMAQ